VQPGDRGACRRPGAPCAVLRRAPGSARLGWARGVSCITGSAFSFRALVCRGLASGPPVALPAHGPAGDRGDGGERRADHGASRVCGPDYRPPAPRGGGSGRDRGGSRRGLPAGLRDHPPGNRGARVSWGRALLLRPVLCDNAHPPDRRDAGALARGAALDGVPGYRAGGVRRAGECRVLGAEKPGDPGVPGVPARR